MAKTYQTGPAGARAAGEAVVPESATIALAKIAESAKEGLLALAVGAGLQVMQAMMDESVLEVCGPSGRRASTTRTGSATGTVPRPARSPWAGGGCQ